MTTTKNGTTTDTTGMVYLDLPIAELADHPANLRFDLGDVSDLAASIAENGLIEPIIVAPLAAENDTSGGYLIIAGHRRTAACRQIGWVTVPAISRPDLASTDGTVKADHLFLMLDENTQREGLTTQEVSAGLAQLAAFPGLTPAKVAKRTGRDVEAVKHAVAAAKLPEDVRPLVVADALTLDQAAELAEFENDPKVYARLIKKLAAGGWGASHMISEERRKRDTNAEKSDIMADLRRQSVRVVGAPNQWDFPRRTRMQPLSNLRTTAGKKVTAAAHAKCDGHAAFLRIDQYKAVGKRITVNHVCTSPEDHGHTLDEQHTGRDSGPTLTEEQQAAEAEQNEAIQLGWAAAAEVRWQWLVTLFRAKQLPDALTQAALGADRPRDEARLLHLLTGREAADPEDDEANQAAYDELIVKDTATRLHRHTVAYMVLSIEDDAQRLDPTRCDSWGGPGTAQWLRRLAEVGYELGDAEQIVTTTWPAK
ncbi:ParB family chromosome partitioning protein [Jatrophihabitans sp. GAS493]|uniref:ParB/RepB/Spo0J family partition protein n=1 Tax=Jatrophihabitans sp. GAS493 TaxID=1907575 RepID=UPI000BB7183F|nr:ParB/RepB/Spo0J family partition protein [Jatrophihabitans sp. GAS493]SOD72870.1 ParB family chromosome partitioning protein [Jatrophihabitans sp. GAS493]